MCPTAGMLGGDRVELNIDVREGAALTLSNPSSLRIHKMDLDTEAYWNQSFRVATNGFLENNPEWLILQGESAFVQRTSIEMAPGADLFFVETIAPGRIAHGERFSFRSFKNRLTLRYDNRLAALEKHAISPELNTHAAWNRGEPDLPFYISVFIASDALANQTEFWREITDLQSATTLVGYTPLAHDSCWNLKLLSSDPPEARRVLETARQLVIRAMGRTPQKLRRQ